MVAGCRLCFNLKIYNDLYINSVEVAKLTLIGFDTTFVVIQDSFDLDYDSA